MAVSKQLVLQAIEKAFVDDIQTRYKSYVTEAITNPDFNSVRAHFERMLKDAIKSYEAADQIARNLP